MKGWINILFCVLFSATIWLARNLSLESTGLVSVPVLAQSNIPGRSSEAGAAVLISARVEASGYKIFSLSKNNARPRAVEFDPEDLVPVEGDYYSISVSSLYKYSEAIFGSGVTILDFIAENVRFRFDPQECRKIPVRPFVSVDYRPQYMALGEISFSPDSVMVYADPARLEMIDEVYTEAINLRDVHTSVHGPVDIEVPVGTRISEEEVEYSLEVTRYIEFRRTLPVEVRGVPRHARVSVLPGESEVTFRCVFPLKADPSDGVSLYVSYEEFASSLEGSCLVHVDGLPPSVISCSLKPEVCVCLEVEQ